MKHNDDIYDELAGLQSKLSDMELCNPYHLPNGYFEGLMTDLKTKISAEKIATLASKQLPYSVPDNYFNKEIKITNPSVAIHQRSIKLSSQKWLAAAAILFIAIGFSMFRYTVQPMNVQQQLAQLHQEGIINDYIQEHIDEFDTDLIEDAYASQDHTLSTEKLSDSEIQEYLNETGWN